MVADQNTFFDAKVTVFKLNDGSTLQDMSAYIKSSRGLPGQFKVNDVTTYGSVGERPGPSIYIVHFSIEFLFNQVTTTGVHTILTTIFTTKVARAFEYYPSGTTVGNPKFSGSAYLPVYEVVSQVGDYVQAHAEFHCDNGITIGTA
jgi:hypothetical protein